RRVAPRARARDSCQPIREVEPLASRRSPALVVGPLAERDRRVDERPSGVDAVRIAWERRRVADDADRTLRVATRGDSPPDVFEVVDVDVVVDDDAVFQPLVGTQRGERNVLRLTGIA